MASGTCFYAVYFVIPVLALSKYTIHQAAMSRYIHSGKRCHDAVCFSF